jgi:hypothetical protein
MLTPPVPLCRVKSALTYARARGGGDGLSGGEAEGRSAEPLARLTAALAHKVLDDTME